MFIFLIALTTSLVLTFAVVVFSSRGMLRGHDNRFDQPQKIHERSVPRIGGLAIFFALVVVAGIAGFRGGTADAWIPAILVACAVPAFLAGSVHDFTDRLTPRGRLFATAASALLAYSALGTSLSRTGVPGLDWVASMTIGAVGFAVLAVVGIAHAVNIIDGLNGLAAMCVVIMLAAIAYVAFEVGDTLIASMSLAIIGAVLGFFVWNYPAGIIFLGDGGAYVLGFLVAEVALLLLLRNNQVSPLFALLVCIYPVFETLFSAYRRFWLRGSAPSLPDGIHLHSLVYKRLIGWAIGGRSADELVRRNSMASPYLWVLCSASVAPAVLFWDQPLLLGLFIVLFGTTYILLYQRIVRFKSPRWLRLGRRSTTPGTLPDDNPST